MLNVLHCESEDDVLHLLLGLVLLVLVLLSRQTFVMSKMPVFTYYIPVIRISKVFINTLFGSLGIRKTKVPGSLPDGCCNLWPNSARMTFLQRMTFFQRAKTFGQLYSSAHCAPAHRTAVMLPRMAARRLYANYMVLREFCIFRRYAALYYL